jgi:hypothetical protein
MVLFNAGVVSRIGPHRINVKLARALAQRGIPTIRFDLHGMGDSLGADGKLSYQQQVVSDLQAAMNTLQNAAGTQHFALLGFCSGALPSYWAAQQDRRVRHIILYDAFALQTRRSRARFFAVRLRNHGFSPASLGLYLRRAASLLPLLSLLPQMLLNRLRRRHTETGSLDNQPSKAQLAQGFVHLAQQGVRVSVLQSGADFSNVNYAAQITEAFGLVNMPDSNLRTDLLAPIDHIMTSVNAQRRFVDWICGDLLGRQPQAPATLQHPSTSACPSPRTEAVD